MAVEAIAGPHRTRGLDEFYFITYIMFELDVKHSEQFTKCMKWKICFELLVILTLKNQLGKLKQYQPYFIAHRVHALEVPVQASELDRGRQRGRLRVGLRGQQG